MTSKSLETTSKSTFKYDFKRFSKFLDNFKNTNFWKSMEATVEDSPWHREANVAVHTEMSLEQARRWFPRDEDLQLSDDRHMTLVSLAVLFHDTGKPPMEVTKESAERGVYRSYANHEQRSARIFEGYTLDHWDEFKDMIQLSDVYLVTWIIEHHLPYSLKQPAKVEALAKSLLALPEEGDADVFFNSLRGDAYGRTSDSWDINTRNVEVWIEAMQIEMFKLVTAGYLPDEVTNDRTNGELVVLVGPSGAGKSTMRKQLVDVYGFKVFSLDDLRVKFAETFEPSFPFSGTEGQKYMAAFAVSVEKEKEFKEYADKALYALFDSFNKIVIDNTNTSSKQRKRYLEMAKRFKMHTKALYFPTSLRLLDARNQTRGDKKLPDEALANLFYAVAVPAKGGEFHDVYVVKDNYAQ